MVASDQRLAVNENPGIQPVHLGLVIEMIEHRQITIRHNDGDAGRLGRKRHEDVAGLLVGGELVAGQPDARPFHRLALGIEHPERMPGGGDARDRVQFAFADQRAAALAVADELDHPRTALAGELREREGPLDQAHRRVVVGLCRLRAGDQAVEVDRGVQVALGLEKVVERIDLEHVDDQLRHVLHADLEHDLVPGGKMAPVLGCDLDLHAVADPLVSNWVEHRKQLLRVALAGQNPRLGEQRPQPLGAHILCIRLVAFARFEQ